MKKIILIPSYEPDEKLINLVKKIDKDEFDVIVVNDGSGDGYYNIFNDVKKYAHLIQYDINKGKGYALKTGFKYIKEKYYKDYIVVTMDSDGQHTIKDARNLALYSEKHLDTLVLGMRKRDLNVPIRSRIGNGITRFVYSVSTGISVYDTQTGLRSFSDSLMDLFLSIDGDRFEYEMNVLFLCAKRHIPIKEIQIETIYIKNNRGSHFNTLKDSYRIYKDIIKFSFASIISFIIDYCLFLLLFFVTKRIVLSNVVARIVSACLNFYLNRKYVFQSDKNIVFSVLSYGSLAIFILLCNTYLLKLLIVNVHLYEWFSKIIVEFVMFFVSWFVQRFVIFKK